MIVSITQWCFSSEYIINFRILQLYRS